MEWGCFPRRGAVHDAHRHKIGTALTRTKNLPLILGVSFALGFAITVAEPDLQVLAQTVPHIKSSVLLVTVGAGVGLFMAICMLRILTGASLRWILIVCYTLILCSPHSRIGTFSASPSTPAESPRGR